MTDPTPQPSGPLPYLIDRLTRLIRAATDALETAYPDGVDDWQQELSRQLARYHAASYLAATGDATLEGAALTAVQQDLAIQLRFLGKFALVVQSGKRWENGYNARAEMYARSIKTPFYRGATKMLPLPAMPAEGTQCLTNCGCSWEISELEGDGNTDAYWRRGKEDSCQTCLQREADWSPIRIRGGVLQL